MLFHRISSGILLALVIAASANAQRSVVFFKENNVSSHSEYDRPRPRLKLLKSFSLPQSVESHPSSASDFPNFNVTSFLLADEDEPSIAINPVDQNNIIMGCNDYRSDSSLWYFASTDGGVHWSGAPFRANWQLAGIATDPAVTFNSSGTALYSYGRIAAGIVFPPSYNLNDVVSFSSSDKGNSWSGPSRAVFDSSTPSSALKLADKYYIAVDGTPTSSFFNRSYLTWAEYQNNQSRIVITHSTDNGAHWSAPVAISPAAHFQCPIPATGPAGDVYVAYEDVAPSHLQIHVARSTDGGATFASDVIVASYRDLGRLYPNDSVYFHPVIKGHVRVNSFPSIAVDHSADHNGRIYLTYAANDANGRAHIYFSASDDNAGHWLVPRPVENDPNIHPTDKFFPWIAVDNSTGDVGIVCYDSRNDSLANELIDTYFLFSHNGGASFTPLRITPYSMDPHASSSRDTVGFGPGDSLEFIGDYLGLDVMNKHWYPSWTDTRVGYDQDIYVAIVRPYAPASPKGFQVVEDAATHLPDLSWSYDGLTTAGLPLGTFSFHLRRTDGLLDSILPPAARTFVDHSAVQTRNYDYTLRVETSDGDTSTMSFASFHPRAAWETSAPMLISASAQSGGFYGTIKIPLVNLAGDTVRGLNKLYYIVDGIVSDSALLHDNQAGLSFQQFFSLADGFHKLELILSTKLPDGDTVLSVRSPARWLYAGVPVPSYAEDFSVDNTTFTPYSWSTTTANGKFSSLFINDSLPFVNYSSNTNTWFCLPSVSITNDTKSLEFDHIAAVASGDSAIAEYSTDDGVNFQSAKVFDANSYPGKWQTALTGSTAVHELLSFKHLIGQNVIARFHLVTHSTGGDGWFIGNIKYTNTAGVTTASEISGSDELRILTDPIEINSPLRADLTVYQTAVVTASVFDLLGRKRADIIRRKLLSAGEYRMEITDALEPGAYLLVCNEESSGTLRILTERFIIVP